MVARAAAFLGGVVVRQEASRKRKDKKILPRIGSDYSLFPPLCLVATFIGDGVHFS
jgi:hypothetical protein